MAFSWEVREVERLAELKVILTALLMDDEMVETKGSSMAGVMVQLMVGLKAH